MSNTTPDDVTMAFQKAFNAGDLDGLLALYEEDAVLAPQPGKRVTGKAAIRVALSELLGLKGKVEVEQKYTMQCGDIALMQGSWRIQGTGPDGNPIELAARTAEVVRRQPDGTWLYIIDHPWQNDDAVVPLPPPPPA